MLKHKKFYVLPENVKTQTKRKISKFGKFKKSFYLVGATIISTKKHGVKKEK
jgi:hypothetical protein